MTLDFLVVGAGISGLLAARLLHDHSGMSVAVVDKGRGVGGRMASRRWAGATFDHGAQFFTARDPAFAAWVDRWQSTGVVSPWFDKPVPGGDAGQLEKAYRGLSAMTDPAKALAGGLTVFSSWEAVGLIRSGARWSVFSAEGEALEATHLVITMPAPQALALLATAGEAVPSSIHDILGRVRYERCLAGLCLLDGPAGLPPPGGIRVGGKSVAWLADNQAKGISEIPAVTIHSTAEFAGKYWDQPDERRLPLLWEEARPFIHSNLRQGRIHRWGFNQPVMTAGIPFLHLDEIGLSLAGDGFGGPRVEGAALSGLSLARRILNPE